MLIARFLRLLTLVLSFASLQLTLLAGGPGCPTPSTGGGLGSVAMAGMGGGAMEAGAPQSAPCDDEAAPSSCPTMAPCIFAVLVPVAQAEMPTTSEPTTVVASVVLTPPSTTLAPELPPPRG